MNILDFFIGGTVIGGLVILMSLYRNRWLALKAVVERNLDVDLELATTDQLMIELRKRPNTYMMLLPVQSPEENSFGISIEVHGMDPVSSCGMLKMAAALTEKELKRQGFSLPEMPDFDADADEEIIGL